MQGLLLFVIFIIAIFFELPIAFALGIAGLTFTSVVHLSPSMVIQSSLAAVDSMALLSVPFFVLAGELMTAGGISKRLINFCNHFMKKTPGSLAMVTVVASAIFAAISGSGPATVACIGGITIPAMKDANYDPDFASVTAAVSGALGPIIPPSICFILYGVIANVSITKLFTGGIIPGLMMTVGLCIWVYFVSRRKGFGVSGTNGKTEAVTEAAGEEALTSFFQVFKEAFWALMVPVIILGGIYGGFMTPTEAAIIASDYALIVGLFIHKEIKLRDMFPIFGRAALTCGTIMILVSTATVFGRELTILGLPQQLANSILGITTNKILVLLVINLFLFVVGMFMETLAAIIILAPLLLDIVTPLGVTPLHFGIVMVLNLVIGMCTPPVGVNLFVAAKIGNIKLEQMIRYLIPALGVLIFILMLITYIPGLTTFFA